MKDTIPGHLPFAACFVALSAAYLGLVVAMLIELDIQLQSVVLDSVDTVQLEKSGVLTFVGVGLVAPFEAPELK